MESVLIAVGSFCLGVYFAEQVRTVVPILAPE